MNTSIKHLMLIGIALTGLSTCRSTSKSSNLNNAIVPVSGGKSFYVYGDELNIIVRECPELAVVKSVAEADTSCPKTKTNETKVAKDTFKSYLVKAITKPSQSFLKFLTETAKGDQDTYKKDYDASIAKDAAEKNAQIDTEGKLQADLNAAVASTEAMIASIDAYEQQVGSGALSKEIVEKRENLRKLILESKAKIISSQGVVTATKALLEAKDKLVGPVKMMVDEFSDQNVFKVVRADKEFGFVSGFFEYLVDDIKLSQIALGYDHSCALLKSGEVKCWGRNSEDQRGTAKDFDVLSLKGEASSISLGSYLSCALLKSGEVQCWGDNVSNQRGTTNDFDVVNLKGEVSSISLGFRHSCALLKSGEVQCWGYNDYNQRGTANNFDIVNLKGEARNISLGSKHSCAILKSGEVQCWGSNEQNRRGTAKDFDVVSLKGEASSISLGETHSCALLKSGEVQCWGGNQYNQRGSAKDFDVISLKDKATSISLGENHTCALLKSGEVQCWGRNNENQRGTAHDFDIVPINPNF